VADKNLNVMLLHKCCWTVIQTLCEIYTIACYHT